MIVIYVIILNVFGENSIADSACIAKILIFLQTS